MVKIFQPGEKPQQLRSLLDSSSIVAPEKARIRASEGTAQQARQSIGALGSVFQGTLRMRQADQARRQRAAALKAANQEARRRSDVVRAETQGLDQAAQFNRHYTDARLSFAEVMNERVQMTVDEEGNPTFENLPDDIGKLGNRIIRQYAKKIKDPVARLAFQEKMNEMVVNAQIGSYKTARAQRVDYATAQLESGLSKLVDAAQYSDSDSVGSVVKDGYDIIDQGRAAGLSEKYLEAQKNRFENNVGLAKIQGLMNTNMKAAYSVLETNSAEALFLDADQHRKLREQVTNSIEQQENLEVSQIIEAIKADEISSIAQVEGAISGLSEYNAKKVVESFSVISQEREAQGAEMRSTLERFRTKGELTQADDSIAEEYFLENEKKILKAGENPSLVDLARFASLKGAAPKTFGKRIASSIENGTPEQAVEAIQAFTRAVELNPANNRYLDDKAKAFIGKYQRVGVLSGEPNKELINKLRDSVYGTDDEIYNKHLSKFNTRITSTSAEDSVDIDAKIRDLYGDRTFYGLDQQSQVDPALRAAYTDLARIAYAQNGGDMDAALLTAHNELKDDGHFTKIGGRERIMLNAPDKVATVSNDPEENREAVERVLLKDIISLKTDPNLLRNIGYTELEKFYSEGNKNPYANLKPGDIRLLTPLSNSVVYSENPETGKMDIKKYRYKVQVKVGDEWISPRNADGSYVEWEINSDILRQEYLNLPEIKKRKKEAAKRAAKAKLREDIGIR